jgi:hypothetical protein
MFPVVKCSISGLDPDNNYAVVMDTIPVGDNRFKFHDSEWVVTGKAEPMGNEKGMLYVHPDTPSSGAKWEKQLLTFQKCTITNNHLDQKGYVSVKSSDVKLGSMVLDPVSSPYYELGSYLVKFSMGKRVRGHNEEEERKQS